MTEQTSAAKQYVMQFLGINTSAFFQEGELSDCTNISSALYPNISQRYDRVRLQTYTAPTALHAKNKLLVVDGTDVFYGGGKVGTVTAGKKQIVTVGNYVVIFPDKVYYNVANEEFGSLDASYTSGAGELTFTDSAVTTTGEDFPFRAGDAVTITGCTSFAENNKTPIIRAVSGKTLTFYENTFTAGTEEGTVTIERKVPDLSYICESNYRLWGVKDNTIYASKYADPFNFNVFDGLTGDSYWIDVGTDGAFTGCIAYSSHICFFKEDVLHKVYGTKPSNYQVVTSQVYGVQAGCEGSLRIVNETLYYKGRNGVYQYTGGVPELISAGFGLKRFSEATAESDGERYYISMKSGDEWGFYAYDTTRNIWLREDGTHALDMAALDGRVYYIAADGGLYEINPDAKDEEIAWSATFCPFNETINEKKGYSKFHFRVDMEAGSWLTVEVNADKEGWKRVYTTHNKNRKTISVPVIPRRSDSVEIRLSGGGRCRIKTFIREFTPGSEV